MTSGHCDRHRLISCSCRRTHRHGCVRTALEICNLSQNLLAPQNLSMEICIKKVVSICIYVKIALTKKRKKISKNLTCQEIIFCDIYVTYGLEGYIVNI